MLDVRVARPRSRAGWLQPGETLICGRCVDQVARDHTDTTTEISAEDLTELDNLSEPELTSEEEYAAALEGEQEWHLRGDGTLARGPRSPWGDTVPSA